MAEYKFNDLKDFTEYLLLFMKEAENKFELDGKQKKSYVLELCNSLIDNSKIGEEERKILSSTINTIVPNMIDTIVSATKGGLNLNTYLNNKNGVSSGCCGISLETIVNICTLGIFKKK